MTNHIPDTTKVEPMSIDDLLAEIASCEKEAQDMLDARNSAYDERHESRVKTCQRITKYITDSRPALEAGTRGKLRFRQVDVSPPYFVPVDMVGREIFHVRYATKERCKEIANDLGLDAEFVEVQSDDR